MPVKAKPSKYRNVRTEVDGVSFASKKEARRWSELLLLQRAGQIRDLERQVRFALDVNGIPICHYVADFTYFILNPASGLEGWSFICEDSKGVETDVFKLKAKLMKAVHGIDVRLS